MKTLIGLVILALAALGYCGCSDGYSCSGNFSYSFCNNGVQLGNDLDCPFGVPCHATDPSTFPCNITDVSSWSFSYPTCPSSCVAPNCRCASPTAPIANPVQMVMLTFDDGIYSTTFDPVNQILSAGLRNPNGCPIRTTWFVSNDYNECDIVQSYLDGDHELASHTYNHTGYPGFPEILTGVEFLVQCANGHNSTPINGFRAPYLEHADWTFQALQNLGFLYDCSSPEPVMAPLSLSMNNKIWPYSMDNGYAGQCWTGLCSYDMQWAGLWQIPMYTFDETTMNSPNRSQFIGTMDLPQAGQAWYNLLMGNFMEHYNGNRAPFGIFVHPAWLSNDTTRINATINFLRAILAMPGVWVVSGQDVIAYMKNPVSATNATRSNPFFKNNATCITPVTPTPTSPTPTPTSQTPTPTSKTPTSISTLSPTPTATFVVSTSTSSSTSSSSSQTPPSTSSSTPPPVSTLTPPPTGLGSGVSSILHNAMPLMAALGVAFYFLF